MNLRQFIRLFRKQASLPVSTRPFRPDPSLIPTSSPRHTRGFRFKRFAFYAIFLFLAGGGFSLYQMAVTPVASVSVDFNPSLEFQINRFGRVVGFVEHGNSPTTWTASIEYRNRLIEDVVMSTYQIAMAEGLVFDNAVQYFLIGIDSSNQSSELAIADRIRQANEVNALQMLFLTEHQNLPNSWYGLGSVTLSPAFTDQPATEGALDSERGPIDSIYNIVKPFELLTEEEYLSLAKELSISNAKLALIVQILVRENQTWNPTRLIQLANTDINQLILVYLR